MAGTATDLQTLKDLATRIRIHSVESTTLAGSGHPTTSSSIADILSVLFFRTMRYKVSAPRDPSSDRFVLSKGHAAPALYGAWVENGVVAAADLKKLRQLGCDLEGHPTPRLNFIDVGTGSLGQGLAVAAGMAYLGKYIEEAPYRVYCLIGDGESAEGSIWESVNFASHYGLDNLVLILDANRLGQTQPTMVGHQIDIYKRRLEAFDFNTIAVDGHDIGALVQAFDAAASVKGRPTAIIAKTYKGRDFPDIEDKENWHGKPLGGETEKILKHLKGLIRNQGKLKYNIPPPLAEVAPVSINNVRLSSPPNYKQGQMMATRAAYGNALVKLAETNPRVVALDGDMSNSTFSEAMKKFGPKNFIECFIAEQNLVGVAMGISCRDRTIAFVSTFAAFFTRAFDQIRMAAISQSNINICGSHCGVSIGEDGPSQMALEDLAMFRSVPGSTVFYPSDVVSVERAVELAANTKGITFIRTARAPTAVVYPNDQVFEVGKALVPISSNKDQALIIAAGITLHESLIAAKDMAKAGIHVRVMDPFTIKPIDKQGIINNAHQAGNRILVVEDHYPEGGIGEAVLSALAEERNIIVKHVAIPRVPRSGRPADLLNYYKIDAKNIVNHVDELLKK
ncbi:transketolase-like protein 2 [Diabrotica virgifera virgifera]|uniref:transketolase n=1 Tax=Diabrotica virgifera virgifera TaxID=50390 RepID=A0A6P7GAR5_DIAVI|nr:transketolase-like protein 2 [Diabrotica virgifera virgifera]